MFRKLLLSFALSLVLLPPAAAQQSVISTTAYDGWVLGCSAQTDKADKAKTVKGCEIRTSVVVQDKQTDRQGVAAVVALGRLLPDQKLKLMTQLPVNAVLTIPVRLSGTDDRTIGELAYLICQGQACTASADLTDVQVTALKKLGDTFFVTYRNQAGQDVRVEVAMKGFAPALDALVKEK